MKRTGTAIILSSLFLSQGLLASNWKLIEGTKNDEQGSVSITCAAGSGWQKCGEKEITCVHDNENAFWFYGKPQFPALNLPPNSFNTLPYTWPLSQWTHMATVDGEIEYLDRDTNLTINKLRPISQGITFTANSNSSNVESLFRSKWGSSFLDVSGLSLTTSKGVTVFPGQLINVHDLNNTTKPGEIGGLTTLYVHEVCTK